MNVQKERTLSIVFFISIFAILFASWLMLHTFGYDKASSSILIAPKAWSDFGAHIPLIRSFSLGNNWPIESPLYPGTPIRYHFLFYWVVGTLERIGLRIDYALNIPSVLGFAGLMILIAVSGKKLFGRWVVGGIAMVLFLFNSSLSFLRFFATHPLSVHTIMDILTNSKFPAFGPWDQGLVSAFWNLNIYTNQRHLAFSYACILVGILLLSGLQTMSLRKKLNASVMVTLCMAILLFTNQASALIAAIWFAWLFLLNKNTRIPLLVAALFSLPYFLLLLVLTDPSGAVVFDPGYLVKRPFTAASFGLFWWHNLGLSLFTIPLGFVLAPRKIRRLCIVPMVLLFAAPNILRFSPDMINNHKLLNFFIIIGNLFTAYALVWLVGIIKKYTVHLSIRYIGYLLIGVLMFFLTLSGIIDLFPIANEEKGHLSDMPRNVDAEFFRTNTNPQDVILNSTWFYHPASIAGRKIFAGYTYFTWSYGYNAGQREQQQVAIFESTSKPQACVLLQQYNIKYVELADKPEEFLKPNFALFQQFSRIYRNDISGISVYDVETSCKDL